MRIATRQKNERRGDWGTCARRLDVSAGVMQQIKACLLAMLWVVFLGHATAVQAEPAQTTCEQIDSDWLVIKGLLPALARPVDCATLEQTPPEFVWADQGVSAKYRFTLYFPDGRALTRDTSHNWLAWPEALAPGKYGWRVEVFRHAQSAGAAGRIRHFTIRADAKPFVVPDAHELYLRAAGQAHPRALPRGAEQEGLIGALLHERQAGVKELLGIAEDRLHRKLPPEPPMNISAGSIEARVYDEMKNLMNAALAWVVSKDKKYLEDARRRALNMASWNPHGATGFTNADQVGRAIAWTLALVYDWLYDELKPMERLALLEAIRPRATDMFMREIESHGLNPVTVESHGNHTVGKLAVIAALLAGDTPEAERWLMESLPLHLQIISPWGGEDGGYANGTNYALWDTGDSFVDWHILRWATGVDVAQKAWVRNFGRFLVYFLPPGTPRLTFGDGAELVPGENWARFGKAYALLAPSPLSRWYATQLFGEDKSRLEVLLAPRDDGAPAPFPEGMANAALFPSIGWVAMHSDLRDWNRISVYFKSSPYGSWNHSHADQNSFVINARGRALAIDSGYFDAYHSPHWEHWTKQTRAHNAITFDGGQGQTHHTILAKGKITQFETGAQMDFVTGDATEAYGGALRKAVRSVVYGRPDQIVVFDRLESATPRRWEWNIHALERMLQDETGRLTIHSGHVSLCVEVQSSTALRFVQTDAFTEPPYGENRPKQWHGRFETVGKTNAATFVALLRVDCRSDAVIKLTQNGIEASATIGAIALRFDGTRVMSGLRQAMSQTRQTTANSDASTKEKSNERTRLEN